MTTAKIMLDTTRKAKNGYPIKIYLYNGKKKLIGLNEFSEIKDWDGINVKKSHPDYRRLWELLRVRGNDLVDEVNYCNEHSLGFQDSLNIISNGINNESEIEVLRKRIRELERQSGAMLFEFWDVFVKEKETEGKSIRHFHATKEQLLKYAGGDVPINEIDYEWLKGFVNFKYADKCGDGGISHYLRTFRNIYLEAQRRESFGIRSGNPFLGLIKSGKKKGIAELSKVDYKRVRAWEPSKFSTPKGKGSAIRRRDIFLFQIYVGGHDLIDVAMLTVDNIKNNRIRLERHKNRSRDTIVVDNLLVPEALEIITKYGSESGRLFDFIPCPVSSEQKYIDFRNHSNRNLRTIVKDLKLTSPLSTKSPRYIFGTWSAEERADIATVMQIQGHKPADVSFRYKGRISHEVQDNEHISILKMPPDEPLDEENQVL